MNKYLFLFTIGPVQSFIAQARKTYDLYAGSKILSELIDHTIKNLPPDSRLIFPRKDMDSKPNQIIAHINCEDPRSIGENLKCEVQEKFRGIAKAALGNSGFSEEPNGFSKHIEDFPNVYWAAVPYNEGDSYPEKYKKLTGLLSAVKNTRTFNQLYEKGRKCSLCGERNALFYKPGKEKNGKEKEPANLAGGAKKTYSSRLTWGEGLCGICFTKRFYNNEDKNGIEEKEFPSTATISLLNVLLELDRDSEGRKIKDEYIRLFDSESYDDQLFFEENLTDEYFDKNGLDKKNLEKIKEKNEELREYIKQIGERDNKELKLSRYYAVIMFDGDDMGKHLAGDTLRQAVSLWDFHRNLSVKLGDFAWFASNYLNSRKYGRSIYAGGDDFLGFVNLYYLFDVMEQLRANFHECVNKPLEKEYLNDSKLTLSAGIVIAHYKIPLGEVLKQVRKMTNKAKNVSSEKDAFCIAVLKHSGGVEDAVCKWDLYGTKSIEIIKQIIKALEDESFSNTFIKTLTAEVYSLIDKDYNTIDKNYGLIYRNYGFNIGHGIENEVLKAEIKRLVERSCKLKNKEEQKKERNRAITSMFKAVYQLYYGNKGFIGNEHKIKNFISLLNILDFIKAKR
jgi:CRISPR-associated protein Cmr2